jgi:hypothetical protein
MTFLELIEKYIKNLYGIDLFEKAGWNVSATPAQAWLNLIFSGLATLIGFFVLYRFAFGDIWKISQIPSAFDGQEIRFYFVGPQRGKSHRKSDRFHLG